MRYEIGEVININKLNQPLPTLVITEPVYEGVTLYSLAKGTDLPVQTYPNYRVYFLLSGKLNVFIRDRLTVKESREVCVSEGMIAPLEKAVGITVLEDSVAIEVILGKKLETDYVHSMEPFVVNKLVNYQPNKAITETIFTSGFVQFDVSCLDMHTAIDHSKALGEMILTGLDGEGTVIYGGKESVLHVGESFRIQNGTPYSIQAKDARFKVSNLIHIE